MKQADIPTEAAGGRSSEAAALARERAAVMRDRDALRADDPRRPRLAAIAWLIGERLAALAAAADR